jgi:hypothetical protein
MNTTSKLPSQPLGQSTRWDAELSPLKISFWFGSPDAPKALQEELERQPEMSTVEPCMQLPWLEAFTVLRRANVSLYEFHPKDLDWQVNGWLLQEAGLYPIAPLTNSELRAWTPPLSPNPETSDFAVEVLNYYMKDIKQLNTKADHILVEAGRGTVPADVQDWARGLQNTSRQLRAGVDAWIEPALVSLEQPEGVVMRIDGRRLLKRAYEIAYYRHSDIDPADVAHDVDPDFFTFAVTRNLVPHRAIELRQTEGG